ncbi:MAG TPA: hypothetical protein VFS21_22535 [Roseiflexaceae bacterium]|nr:hypothetical protein [Roseiflexaceae bacterium]
MDTLLDSPSAVLLLIGLAILVLRGSYRPEPQITYIPVPTYEPHHGGCLSMVLSAILTLLAVAFIFSMLTS